LEFRVFANPNEHKTSCDNNNNPEHRRNRLGLELQTAFRFLSRRGAVGGSGRTYFRRSLRKVYHRETHFRDKSQEGVPQTRLTSRYLDNLQSSELGRWQRQFRGC
jgi:hypothetical protein